MLAHNLGRMTTFYTVQVLDSPIRRITMNKTIVTRKMEHDIMGWGSFAIATSGRYELPLSFFVLGKRVTLKVLILSYIIQVDRRHASRVPWNG